MQSQYLFIILAFVSFLSNSLSAAVHFTLRGSANRNNLGLNHQEERSASGSVAVDLGSHLRLGITHQQGYVGLQGYQYNRTANAYYYVQEKTHTIANSLDLTVILYYGDIFVPFVQVGVIKKRYLITYSTEGSSQSVSKSYALPPVPNTGVGLGIRLNTNFSLNITYTVSPGIRQARPDQRPQSVLDSYLSLGLSYQI